MFLNNLTSTRDYKQAGSKCCRTNLALRWGVVILQRVAKSCNLYPYPRTRLVQLLLLWQREQQRQQADESNIHDAANSNNIIMMLRIKCPYHLQTSMKLPNTLQLDEWWWCGVIMFLLFWTVPFIWEEIEIWICMLSCQWTKLRSYWSSTRKFRLGGFPVQGSEHNRPPDVN